MFYDAGICDADMQQAGLHRLVSAVIQHSQLQLLVLHGCL